MSRKARNRMTRETIPKGFSAPMAFVDLLPVVFFGLSAVKAGNLFHSGLFVAGGGSLPALGRCEGGMEAHRGRLPKEHLADACADARPDAVGFLTMFAALIVDRAGLNGEAMLAKLSGFPACLFFLAGALGMILMLVFAFRMDSSDPKVNWMEQTVNSLAQIRFFIGLMLA